MSFAYGAFDILPARACTIMIALVLQFIAEAQAGEAGGGIPQFNNTKCPAFWELQAPHVAGELQLQDLEGFFYELAFHDYTQYPLCLVAPRCVTSFKKVQEREDGTKFVNDTWNLSCVGHPYPQQLLFNFTEHPGYLLGYWPKANIPFLPKRIAARLIFPDTVVDFKRGPRGWLLEFQCVEWKGHVVFVGINFYAKVKDEATFAEMERAARARGLGLWLDHGFGLRRVDHSNCSGPALAGSAGTAAQATAGVGAHRLFV